MSQGRAVPDSERSAVGGECCVVDGKRPLVAGECHVADSKLPAIDGKPPVIDEKPPDSDSELHVADGKPPAPSKQPKREPSPAFYKAAIVIATVIWGYAFVGMKEMTAVLPPSWLLGLRFLIAGAVLAVALRKRIARFISRKTVLMGIVLALADFAAFWTQTVGLLYTTPGINAFLTATYCVIVPFLWGVIARRRPTVFNLVAAVVALVGIWFVSVSSGALTMGFGEGMTLLCAVFFAVHIVLVSKFSRSADALTLTAVQFLAEGVLGCALGAATETFPGFDAFTPGAVGQLLFLAIFATVVAFGIQNVSLAHVPPAQASIFLSLESVFGVVFGVLLCGDRLTPRLLVGFVLIFAAILISETLPLRKNVTSGGQSGPR